MDEEEALAQAAHDAWLAEKRRRGVTSWPNEAGIEQMVPYADCDESIREFDRVVVRSIMRTVQRLRAARGGRARWAKLSPERRSEIARNAVAARWRKARGD